MSASVHHHQIAPTTAHILTMTHEHAPHGLCAQLPPATAMQHLFYACYPPWLVSALMSNDHDYSDASSWSATIPEAEPNHLKRVFAPQPQHASLPLHTSYSPPSSGLTTPSSSSTPESVLSRPSPQSHHAPYVALPLPFSDACVANKVNFTSRSHRGSGVNLGEWVRLAEKRKTHLALKGAQESLEEVFEFAGEGEGDKILFQSHVSPLSTSECPKNHDADGRRRTR